MFNSNASQAVKLLLVIVLAAGAGLAVKAMLAPATPAKPAAASTGDAALAQQAAARNASAGASLDTAVLVAGARHDARDGRIALPSGTRFQLRVISSREGQLEMYAVTPDGRSDSQPVWSGKVGAGVAVITPALRLEGARGLETMNLVLRAPGQEVAAHSTVEIWHL
ncbi:MAG: hypothetical protein V4857_11270 [Pseudomonadota bacterium]